jgi:adenylate cyclase
VQRAGPKRLWAAVALAGLAVAIAGMGVWWALHKNAPIPIAVLPLVNLSQDSANEYFADGLTDEIIRNLSILDGLAVRSQTSSSLLRAKRGTCTRRHGNSKPTTSWKVQ